MRNTAHTVDKAGYGMEYVRRGDPLQMSLLSCVLLCLQPVASAHRVMNLIMPFEATRSHNMSYVIGDSNTNVKGYSLDIPRLEESLNN